MVMGADPGDDTASHSSFSGLLDSEIERVLPG